MMWCDNSISAMRITLVANAVTKTATRITAFDTEWVTGAGNNASATAITATAAEPAFARAWSRSTVGRQVSDAVSAPANCNAAITPRLADGHSTRWTYTRNSGQAPTPASAKHR